MDERKKELLGKFADRMLTPQELEEFLAMMANDQGEDDLDLQFGEADIDVPQGVQEASIADIKEGLTQQLSKKRKMSQMVRKALTAAAAIIVIVGGVKGYFQYKYIQNTRTLITVNVPVGKMQKIFLADSSVVTVSSGSVFKYPKAFPKGERVVYLTSGKAFFEVAKDHSRPFSVKSGDLATTALGTSFTVQYNAQYHWEKVNLYTGKVVINKTIQNHSAAAVFLTPGKAYEFLAGEGYVTDFDQEHLKPLTEKNSLHFEHIPFNEAVYQIASYYKIRIKFNPGETLKYSINGDFTGQTIEETLQALVFIHHLKFTKSDSLNYSIMKK